MVVEVSDNGEIQMQTRVTRLWKQTAVYPKKMIDRRYRARAGPVETGRARVFVDEACVLTMMRPSMTVSVFS